MRLKTPSRNTPATEINRGHSDSRPIVVPVLSEDRDKANFKLKLDEKRQIQSRLPMDLVLARIISIRL